MESPEIPIFGRDTYVSAAWTRPRKAGRDSGKHFQHPAGRRTQPTAATNFFKVDLDSLPAGQTFNVAMLLTNNTSAGGWESLQLKVEQKDVGAGGSCATPGTIFDGAQNPKVMYFDQADEGVYWNAL